MKAAVKRDWLKALRGGEYKQGRGQLCNAKGAMCCLGVLIDVAIDGEWELESYRNIEESYAFKGMIGMPPESVLAQLGLHRGNASELAHMNDSSGSSFQKIANWIEANVPVD